MVGLAEKKEHESFADILVQVGTRPKGLVSRTGPRLLHHPTITIQHPDAAARQ